MGINNSAYKTLIDSFVVANHHVNICLCAEEGSSKMDGIKPLGGYALHYQLSIRAIFCKREFHV